MKINKKFYLAPIALLSVFHAYAMDLNINRIDVNGNSAAAISSDMNEYPNKIALILGYTTTGIKNSTIDNYNVAATSNGAVANATYGKSNLSGAKLGITQLISEHLGYEADINYYVPVKTNQYYASSYAGDPLNIVSSTINTKTTALTADVMGIAALHLSSRLLLAGKLGIGYERVKTITASTMSFTNTTPSTVSLINNTDKNNGFGVATGAGLTFDLNPNISLGAGADYLIAKKDLLAFEATLLMRL